MFIGLCVIKRNAVMTEPELNFHDTLCNSPFPPQVTARSSQGGSRRCCPGPPG